MSWANYQDKVRRYFPFSNTEWKNFGLLVFVFALMWSFDRWGGATFDAAEGVKNFLIAAVTIGIVVFVHAAVVIVIVRPGVAPALWRRRFSCSTGVRHGTWRICFRSPSISSAASIFR